MLEFRKWWTKKMLLGLAIGQFASLLITSTNFSSSEIAKRGIDAPTSQSFLNYALLALVFGSIMIIRRKALKMKWWSYLILAAVDVEANFLVVKAYQYTSITSVMMLDSWVIPCVIVLTWVFLKTRYKIWQFGAVILCTAGSILVVFSDVHAGDRAGGSNPLKGNLFVIAASTLYAVSNVTEEFLVKHGDQVELIAMLATFGTIISGVQMSILERNQLKAIHWTREAILLLAGFTAAMFLFYSTVPKLLKITGAAMLNLSLLTSDMWAVLIRIFEYDEKVDFIYYIAFAAVAIGLVLYAMRKKEAETNGEEAQNGNQNMELKGPDEEAGAGDSTKEPAEAGNSNWIDNRHDPAIHP